MDKFHHKLVSGMQQRGYDSDFAERIFKQICGFGEYGFPESHSASFALLAYVSAWLKYYYPAAFYTSLLNSLPMGFYSASQLIQDAKRHNITVLAVDINHSTRDHTLVPISAVSDEENQDANQPTNPHEPLAIRLGFRLVKGLSSQGIELILQQRPESGFRYLKDIQQSGLNKGDLSALASADVFVSLAGNRYQTRWDMMATENNLPLFANLVETDKNLLSTTPSLIDNLTEDYRSTGLSLGKHPIAILREQDKLTRHTSAKDLPISRNKSVVTVCGIVSGKQSPGTASGVTFMTLEDDTGNINVVVWKGTAQQQRQAFLTASLLQVKGIVEREGDVIHVIAGKLTDITYLLADFKGKSRDFR
jgi:error-prone DNA polymerase